MFDRLFATIAAVTAFTAATHTSAQTAEESSPDDEFIIIAWLNPADCNHTNASNVSFASLAADQDGLIGECIAVDGYWSGRALFNSKRDARARRSNTVDRLRGKRVGLYAQWEIIGEPPEEPTRTTFVGREGRCETQWPGALMVIGYCHYAGGPIVLVSQAFPS